MDVLQQFKYIDDQEEDYSNVDSDSEDNLNFTRLIDINTSYDNLEEGEEYGNSKGKIR